MTQRFSAFLLLICSLFFASCIERRDKVRPVIEEFTLNGNDYLAEVDRGESVIAFGNAVDNDALAQGQFYLFPDITSNGADWSFRTNVEADGNRISASKSISVPDTILSGIYAGEFIVIDQTGNSQTSPEVQLIVRAPGADPAIEGLSLSPSPDNTNTISVTYGDSIQFEGLVSDTAFLERVQIITRNVNSGGSLPGYTYDYNLPDSLNEASLDSLYFGPSNPDDIPSEVPQDDYQMILVIGNDNGYYAIRSYFLRFD